MSVYALLECLVPRKLEEVVTVVIFTLWVPRIKFWPSGRASGAVTCQAMSPALSSLSY